MAICVDREKCIGCESCIAVCPVGALNMVDGKANIDQDTCIAVSYTHLTLPTNSRV